MKTIDSKVKGATIALKVKYTIINICKMAGVKIRVKCSLKEHQFLCPMFHPKIGIC